MPERFELARASELHADIAQPEGKNPKARKAALRKAVSNMTVSNPEMFSLFPEVLQCLKSPDLEVKRLCFLFLEIFAKSRPQQAADSLPQLKREAANKDLSPTVRAIALRTISNIPSKAFAKVTLDLIPDCLNSPDSYLRKTACFATSKVWSVSPDTVEPSGVLTKLNQMLAWEKSPVVAAAAAQTLINITERAQNMQFVIDFPASKRLSYMLSDSPEFSQVSILNALSLFVPQTAEQANQIADQVIPGLRHTNAAVAVGSARVLLMLSHYSPVLNSTAIDQIFAPLLSQLNRPPEMQYAVMRNIQLILQSLDQATLKKLRIPPQAFFCRSSDVPYIRSTKIDILATLCNDSNSETIINELLEFTKIKDPEATKRAISSLGSVGMRFEDVALECVDKIKPFIELEPQAICTLVTLIRRYPSNQYLISSTLDSMWELDGIPQEQEARQSYIWLIGNYYNHGPHATKLLSDLIEKINEEPLGVQYTLMTACIKIFIRFPKETQGKLVPRVFEIASDSSPNPDVRERALMYWRMLSQYPTKMGILANFQAPPVVKEVKQDSSHLEELELSLGYLSSIYLKPADQLFRVSQPRQLKPSPALLPRKIKADEELTNSAHFVTAQSTGTPTPLVTSPGLVTIDRRASIQSQGYFSPTAPLSPTSPSDSDYNGKMMPVPPTPRPRAQRTSSVQAQFSGLHLNASIPEEQNERLIDI